MMKFCENCRDIVDFSIREEVITKVIKGKEISYKAKVAFCKECGQEIFVGEIRDQNLKMLDIAYREHEELIQVSEIESILEKYNIGKRPLSMLLNWGEGTLTRYLDGDVPTKQYSETLRLLLEDYGYMFNILEKNKDKLTERAYKLCKEAIEKIETKMLSGDGKIDSVVKYFIINCVEITPLALQKLLYFAQGFYKAFNYEYLFDNDCEAWVHGPVYRNVYEKYKNRGYNPIEDNISEYDDFELAETEKEILDSIIVNFGCFSGKILEKMTHVETPWRITRKGLGNHESSNRIIEKHLISEYFSEIKSKYKMLNTSDIKDYSSDLFTKLVAVQ
ncbi:type II toxin-antitoxin system antitoxin SocA domain-containing protein [Desulfosporosinus hippei]|uniref:Putative zinc finger/helix-turn-helix protein, YgiT family n=1 Tax=Desulfosporosinus hippei DSM 8344 TaxID=1121419 RepID=A0A1G7U5I4_9FIRM|nr:type II toxin-antitoxin system antitoxin SocA domain-containing protein [Desulfosporosinus hippei]SDG42648.1 putative zinc finger/helix-turn-helix protein, YgiT family [Desulfosporosinus hippei DSM 8344]